ncbi:MAG: EbsA family protein [Succinivibrionaceae bacterium]|nr:EbsA family protein [Succinivibrionaceae bacterium]
MWPFSRRIAIKPSEEMLLAARIKLGEENCPPRIEINDPENSLHNSLTIGSLALTLVFALELVVALLSPSIFNYNLTMGCTAGFLASFVFFCWFSDHRPGVVIDLERNLFIYTVGLWRKRSLPLSTIYEVHVYERRDRSIRSSIRDIFSETFLLEIKSALGTKRLVFTDRETRGRIFYLLSRLLELNEFAPHKAGHGLRY